MPIMAPLADLVGVERQVAVLSYQLGDAFTNFIVPTSGCLLGALAAAKLEWGQWAKFQIKIPGIPVCICIHRSGCSYDDRTVLIRKCRSNSA